MTDTLTDKTSSPEVIMISRHVAIQGDCIRRLPDGQIVIRQNGQDWCGIPVTGARPASRTPR